jgi:hypothetical protein
LNLNDETEDGGVWSFQMFEHFTFH